MKPIIYFDVETTGTDAGTNKIIELAAVKYLPDGTNTAYEQRFRTDIKIPESVTAVHGITNEDLQDKPYFREKAGEIAEFFRGCDIAGYNVMFDVNFLCTELLEAGFEPDFGRIIDVYLIYKQYEPATLSAVYKRLTGDDLVNAHSALADVIATRVILEKISEKGFCTMDAADLEKLSGNDNMADYAHRFYFDEAGELRFNFGKHEGKRVADHIDYAEWMCRPDNHFPAQSIWFLKKYLKGEL